MLGMGVIALIAAALVLVVPGLGLVLAARLRLLVSVTLLAPASLAVIAVSAGLGHVLHVPWSPLPPLLLGALGAVPVALTTRRARPPAADIWPPVLPSAALGAPRPGPSPVRAGVHARPDRSGHERIAVLGGLAAGGTLLAGRVTAMMGSLHAVTQTYDGIFHLSAVRLVLERHDASAFVVGSLTARPGSRTFYPALWHQATSLVAMATGSDVVVATNALLVLVCVVLWPLSIVYLVRSTTAAGPAGIFAAGLFASVSAAFPIAPAAFGILLPFLLSMALVPVGLALVVQVLRWDGGAVGRSGLTPLQALLVLPVVGTAIALAHPQGILALMVLAAPVVIWVVLVRSDRLLAHRGGLRPVIATGALAVVLARVGSAVWVHVRPGRASSTWLPIESVPQAIGTVTTLAPSGAGPWWPTAGLLIAAMLLVVLATRSGWLVAAWAWAACLAVAALSMQDLDYRYVLTGPWYTDTHRVVALPLVVAVPALAVGTDVAVRLVARGARLPRTALAPVAAVASLVALLATCVLSPPAIAGSRDLAGWWADGTLLSADERALLKRMPEEVADGAVVAVDPWDGGSLAYALTGTPVSMVFPVGYHAPDAVLLGERLHEIHADPAVCDAAARANVRYVLDFGVGELWGMSGHFAGTDLVGDVGTAAHVLDRQGGALLLELEPCTRSDGSVW